MKKFLLLALLIGLPNPLFAGSSTSGYKESEYCYKHPDYGKVSLMKKENDNSKNWGVYTCSSMYTCSWADKAVSYDTAVDKYNEKSEDELCDRGKTYIEN